MEQKNFNMALLVTFGTEMLAFCISLLKLEFEIKNI